MDYSPKPRIPGSDYAKYGITVENSPFSVEIPMERITTFLQSIDKDKQLAVAVTLHQTAPRMLLTLGLAM